MPKPTRWRGTLDLARDGVVCRLHPGGDCFGCPIEGSRCSRWPEYRTLFANNEAAGAITTRSAVADRAAPGRSGRVVRFTGAEFDFGWGRD